MKVSVIMQSYLGEYPGSRVNSDIKFLRAVKSFIDQEDKESELIIVSDGCMITHKLYYDHFKTNDRVKYVYVDKDTLNMYEETNEKFFRGFPRQVGRTLATGEITTYMDSDDFLLPTHISEIKKHWVRYTDISWLINLSWIENVHRFYNPIIEYDHTIQKPIVSEITEIIGLPSEWIPYRNIRENNLVWIPTQTCTLTHLSNSIAQAWAGAFSFQLSLPKL